MGTLGDWLVVFTLLIKPKIRIVEAETILNSILCPRNPWRHVQIGLSTAKEKGMVTVPIDVITAMEIDVCGSLTMPIIQYEQMMGHIKQGILDPGKAVTRTVTLEETPYHRVFYEFVG